MSRAMHPVPLRNSTQGCGLRFGRMSRLRQDLGSVALRLLCLIAIRVLGWLVLLGTCHQRLG